MLPAQVLNWASSPQRRGVRPAWPSADVPHSPTIAGIPRHHAVSRFRGLPQPPSPTRLVQSGSNQPGPSPLRERDVATPASSYTSRQNAADSRREDEEHGATQLILLLTLSVVLLTLPWVVDHPVTLLVPVALLILPITSGALRSMLSEGVSLLFGGMRWFWRHRKTAAPQQAQQQQAQQHNGAGFGGLPGMHPSSTPHGHGPQPNGAAGWPHHTGGPGAYGAQHHHGPAQHHHMPHPHHQHQPHQQQQQHQQPHPAMRSADHHVPAMRSVDHHGRPAAPMPPSPGRQPQQQAWQAHATPPHQHHHAVPHPGQAWQPAPPAGVPMAAAAVPHVAAAPHASHSDLTTPDLDFESDLEADAGVRAFAAQASPRGAPAHGAMPFPAHGPGTMHQPPAGQAQTQQQPVPHHPPAQPAAFASHAVHPPPHQPLQQQQQQQTPQQRPRPAAGLIDSQAECHIRNWDEPECTARRGHRPLSELMNNGQ